MSAEPIARVVADLRAGRARNILDGQPRLYRVCLERCRRDLTVVDATGIYRSLTDNPRPVYLYEDHPCIAPPWPRAAVCYENDHGNVTVMQVSAEDVPAAERRPRWETAEPVDWGRVRWVIDTAVWFGGSSEAKGGPIPTFGPVLLWSFAVYEDGEPADLHWVQVLTEFPKDQWGNLELVLLGALNFMNCRNVELVEPRRERHERRRIERTGVRVHTINVLPVGRTSRSRSQPDGQGLVVPLTSVVGHFAHYGPAYGRGLLFGKLEGRYWIPQHARGSEDQGRSEADYRLVPDVGSPRS